ncbi:uncharacterized protein PFL1_03255 [Pseudozyma flocculosa PF-1]|uniref:phosphomevalonate kinase n=2 Tax=Pseudozyma flocculosa TaxID=84751 RepID=A0A5C3F640_9BASI|nr:uncharacterized protein PFL1_03255 [Pseudozyma flocculosa PF-1]EPQ28965.1 hypothetical protein PFL1_03255 [Pseudozyma flocculosa PF-1]SPO39958.1 related to ERG8 - phosphomevalonate kinase [Pseudozyma flocculosa]
MSPQQQGVRRTTLASAPGKVLIAGGYLVLDAAYPGLVISTDSRFYTHAASSSSHDAASAGEAPSAGAARDPGQQRGGYRLTVRSPQFVDAVWSYTASVDRDAHWKLEQTRASFDRAGRNPFVSLALLYTLRLASEILGRDALVEALAASSPGGGIELVVVGDNDFYSQRDTLSLSPSETPTIAALEALPPFAQQSCRIADVHKTGLGSSAAMTTSLVGCLLTHLGAVELDSDSDDAAGKGQPSTHSLALIHNLAQLAHCAAQGKVGSGFDVSAAVWGSQLYRRFDPAVLKPCLDEGVRVGVEGEAASDGEQAGSHAGGSSTLRPTLDPLNPLWRPSPLSSSSAAGQSSSFPTAVEGLVSSSSATSQSHGGATLPSPAPLSLPPGFDMVLADVDAGSNTPSLVSKVLAWRAAKPAWAGQLYAVLASSNASLADHFLNLRLMHDADPEVYDGVLAQCSGTLAAEWDALLRATPGPDGGQHQEEDGGEEEVEVTPHAVLSVLIEVRNTLRAIRAGMRELGTRSGAPVEPVEMGRLIHRVAENVRGIVGGGVPGAGGYDALYLLYLVPLRTTVGEGEFEGPRDTRSEIQAFWQMAQREQDLVDEEESTAKGAGVMLNVGPLLSRAGQARGQDEGLGGFRIEDVDGVRGLKQAIAAEPRSSSSQ